MTGQQWTVLIAILIALLLIGWSAVTVRRRTRNSSRRGFVVVTSTRGGKPAEPIRLRTIADFQFLKPTYDEGQLLWPKQTMTTFGRGVYSILPGDFEAYVKIFNPFHLNVDPPTTRRWSELAAEGFRTIDETRGEMFALHGVENAQARVGELDKSIVAPLIEHLAVATNTPSRCFFAAWEGYGSTIARDSDGAYLSLPGRGYYVFEGAIEGAGESFDAVPFGWQSANLWWPEDHAWFVSTEVDFAWTYVGGSRKLIDELLDDARFDLVEVSAADRW